MKITKTIVVALLFVLLLVLIWIGPIFTIWSINTLFGLEIPITFNSWAAVVWLMTVFHGIRFQINRN